LWDAALAGVGKDSNRLRFCSGTAFACAWQKLMLFVIARAASVKAAALRVAAMGWHNSREHWRPNYFGGQTVRVTGRS